MSVKVTLTMAEIFGLETELSGAVNQSTGEKLSKGLLAQPITLVTKFRLTELQKSLVEHKKTFETLRDELITKLGTKDADGNVSIPMYLESASEEAPKEINPVFIQFNQEFEAVLSETREITTQKFDISEFDFKTDENYPVFFKVLENSTIEEYYSRIAYQRDRKGYSVEIPTSRPSLPMLAQEYKKNPEFAQTALQPKLDGIRCIMSNEGLLSRKNRYFTSF